MKSLTQLWQEVAQDLGDVCDVSTTRDFQTVTSRVEDEGLSFLTITLPRFAKDLEKGLEQGKITHDLFLGFKRSGGLPRFLGGFLELIFDRASGVLLDNPSSDGILAVRQACLFYSKIEIPCTDARNRSAIKGYLDCEDELKSWDKSYESHPFRGDFQRISRLLFADVFTKIDRDVYNGVVLPRHGPGQTADKRLGNKKFIQFEWPERLEREFSYTEFALPNHRYSYVADHVRYLPPRDERPVRVTLVPKTLKAPRIIAIEPTAMQYMQQGLMSMFVTSLETPTHSGKESHIQGMLGFTDQTPNQRMAQEGSLTGNLATLDLSEASDRVSNQLVLDLFAPHPWLSRGVQATRSRKADVLGKTIRLSKFASMGSALCFPIEAMVFLTISMIGIERARGRRLTRNDIQSLRGRVRVYGDDIIVPVDYTRHVISTLELFGLKVNTGKSFWNGRFRESCGKDYYNGDDVSVVKCRQVLPSSRASVEEIVSAVSVRNHLYERGFWRSAKHLDRLLTKILGNFPAVSPESPALGRISFLGYDEGKMCEDLHKPLVKAWKVFGDPPTSIVDGIFALQKYFLKQGSEPFADVEHLNRSGRPRALHIQRGWYSAV